MITDVPTRILRLPHDKHGRPVPWFVATVRGVPDFRVVKPGAVAEAVVRGLCWVCGGQFTKKEPRAFVIGPMCAVNLNSAEPPAHYECAIYSARNCPFLVHPGMVRRERRLPAGTTPPPGGFITRNPGVALVWVIRHDGWHPWRLSASEVLFHIGARPEWVEWFAHGRRATRTEALDAISTGLPTLRAQAALDGAEALAALDGMHAEALRLVPR